MMHNEIYKILEKHNITNYNINDDNSIDVNGDVDLFDRELTKIPLRFNYVSGDFTCSFNKLISLEGSPREVGGSFYCNHNKLTILKDAPSKIGIDFDCSNNELTTLKGAPLKVGGNFYCSINKLKSLKSAPSKIGNNFVSHGNPVNLNYEKYLKTINRIDKIRTLKEL